jgi:hypothetical protein
MSLHHCIGSRASQHRGPPDMMSYLVPFHSALRVTFTELISSNRLLFSVCHLTTLPLRLRTNQAELRSVNVMCSPNSIFLKVEREVLRTFSLLSVAHVYKSYILSFMLDL